LPHLSALPKELASRRTRAELFASLASTVISQQLGTAAADTIRDRVKKACGGKLTPEAIKRAKPATLRAAGLSGAKLKTLQSLAEVVSTGKIDLLALAKMSQETAKSRLTEIWGVGPWSAEMFLMFALGLPDVFSPGDLGLARSIEAIYGLPKNAPREQLLEISNRWIPYRTFAALALWQARDAK
jgi:DNA-3-methyladenine glycosylase II